MLAAIKKLIPTPLKRDTRRLLLGVADSLRYRRMDKPGKSVVRHVVFVCKGNICRSAYAEKSLLQRLNGEGMRVESCGLEAWSGAQPPEEAIRAAAEFGVDLSGHRARTAEECRLAEADLIMAMEFGQLLDLARRWPQLSDRLMLLRSFAPWPTSLLCNIDDPFGCEPHIYNRCFTTIDRALDALTNSVRK
jgi:protein-tyrosine phosphatase